MTYEAFLQRKADENAHNEIMAFLTVILGTVILIGGLLVTVIMVEDPGWFLLLPYQSPFQPSNFLGLILTSAGFSLLAIGFILVIHYDRKKSWFANQLEKSTLYKEGEKRYKSISEVFQEQGRR